MRTDAVLAELELIPGALSARVFVQEVLCNQGPTQLWTYCSAGLREHAAHEVVISVARRATEREEDYPQDPLQLLCMLYDFAKQGKPHSAGGFAQLGPAGFLGDPQLRGFMYVKIDRSDGLPEGADAPSYLALLALTAEELTALVNFGPTRVLASLGLMYRFFPFPFWIERGRSTSVSDESNQRTLLGGFARARMDGIYVLDRGGAVLLLRIAAEARQTLADVIAQTPDRAVLALLTALDPEANACRTWAAGRDECIGIGPDGADGSRMTGAFLALVPKQPEDAVRTLEDGFAIFLTERSWDLLREALRSGGAFALPAKRALEGIVAPGFALEWLPERPAPSHVVTWPGRSAVRLLQPDLELRKRGADDSSALASYVAALTEVAAVCFQHRQIEADGLLIGVGVQPGRRARAWCESVGGAISADALHRLEEGLAAVPPIALQHGPLAFLLELTFPGRTVDAFPGFPAPWVAAAEAADRPLSVPDELFARLWPLTPSA